MIHADNSSSNVLSNSGMNEEFLTVAEVAREISRTPAAVRRLANLGRLTPIRTATGVRIFRAKDVARLVAERRGCGSGATGDGKS